MAIDAERRKKIAKMVNKRTFYSKKNKAKEKEMDPVYQYLNNLRSSQENLQKPNRIVSGKSRQSTLEPQSTNKKNRIATSADVSRVLGATPNQLLDTQNDPYAHLYQPKADAKKTHPDLELF